MHDWSMGLSQGEMVRRLQKKRPGDSYILRRWIRLIRSGQFQTGFYLAKGQEQRRAAVYMLRGIMSV